jgi:hypothetical protein
MVTNDIYLKAHSKNKSTAAAVNGLFRGCPQKLQALGYHCPREEEARARSLVKASSNPLAPGIFVNQSVAINGYVAVN